MTSTRATTSPKTAANSTCTTRTVKTTSAVTVSPTSAAPFMKIVGLAIVAALLAILAGGRAAAAPVEPAPAAAVSAVGTDWLASRTAASSTVPETSPDVVQLAGPGLSDGGCLGPDIRCDVQDGVGNVVDAVVPGIDLPSPSEVILNPLAKLGELIVRAAAAAWTAAMLAVWSAGLFVLRVVLTFTDSFLTPDLSEDGPGRNVYAYTLWIGGALVLIMAMLQLGLAAFRRDGKTLATMLIGTGQFVVVWAAWIGYCVIMVTACGGLTRALMKALLGVDSWPEWDPASDFSSNDVTDATVATVLGLLGMVLWLAAMGHLLVLLTRAAALIILAATGAISAAGLVSDAGRSWFWKSLRWFHAAALTPVIMVLVLGMGVQLATGVASGLTDTTQRAIGTALPAVVLICVSCVAPLALFKLLAFVDPSTPSGASVRAGLAGVGGVGGLLSGGPGAGSGGPGSGSGSTAAQTDSRGRSAGESGAEGDTSSRFIKSMAGAAAGAMSKPGSFGAALGAGAGMLANIGAKGASVGADVSNQMGVGHSGYQPDFTATSARGSSDRGQSGANGSGGEPQPPSGEGTPGGVPGHSGGSQDGDASGFDPLTPIPTGSPNAATPATPAAPGPAAVQGPGQDSASQGASQGADRGAAEAGDGHSAAGALKGGAPGGAGGASAAGGVPPVPV